ncbi:universal stress protein [candidate division KSB1 bacterium]|nr:universal stress protein [candidate division KSB1 bacterium]
MPQIKKILFPTDFSDSADFAFAHACLLAEFFKAELTMLHVVALHDDDPYHPEHKFPDIEEYYDQRVSTADKHLKRAKQRHDYDITVHHEVRRGVSPAEEILDFIQEHGIDLVAMGTHGRNAVSRFLLGSIAEKVIHYAPCPVLSSCKDPTRRDIREGYKKILVPTDFSPSSERALDFALQLFPDGAGQLHVVHVVDDSIHPAYYASGKTSLFDLLPDLRKRSLAAIDKFLSEKIPEGITIKRNVLEGGVAHRIAAYELEKDMDLLVMGARGTGQLEEFVLGSIADRVVRKAECPVLTVK